MRRLVPVATLRIAACATGAVVLSTAASAWAESHQSAPGVSTVANSLRLAIHVPRMMRIQLLDHPRTVTVGAEDVARGYVTVTGPRIDLQVNDRHGYTVRAQVVGAAFSTARVSGLPSAIDATPEATVSHFASMTGRHRAQPYAVVYELKLADGASPGVHPWPVVLALEGP